MLLFKTTKTINIFLTQKKNYDRTLILFLLKLKCKQFNSGPHKIFVKYFLLLKTISLLEYR